MGNFITHYKSISNLLKRDFIAVIHFADYKTRCFIYEIYSNCEYKLLGYSTKTLQYTTKKDHINSIINLIKEAQLMAGVKINKVIVNAPYSKIKITNENFNHIPYNKSYSHKNNKLCVDGILSKYTPNKGFSVLDYTINNVSYGDGLEIIQNKYINSINFNLQIVEIENDYHDYLLSIFDYLSIEIVKIIYDDLTLRCFFHEQFSGNILYLDYNNIILSCFIKDSLHNIISFNYGLNKLFGNMAKKLNLPDGIFDNLYQQGLKAMNFINKSFILSFLNTQYKIDSVQLKNIMDFEFKNLFEDMENKMKEHSITQQNIHIIGEHNNLLGLNQSIYTYITQNVKLQNQLEYESKNFPLFISKIKGISMLKYYLKYSYNNNL